MLTFNEYLERKALEMEFTEGWGATFGKSLLAGLLSLSAFVGTTKSQDRPVTFQATSADQQLKDIATRGEHSLRAFQHNPVGKQCYEMWPGIVRHVRGMKSRVDQFIFLNKIITRLERMEEAVKKNPQLINPAVDGDPQEAAAAIGQLLHLCQEFAGYLHAQSEDRFQQGQQNNRLLHQLRAYSQGDFGTSGTPYIPPSPHPIPR